MAITIAPKMKNNAFMPKKLNNKIVIGRFAQGEASKNAITEAIEAPFLYNSIEIANIPWLHVDIMKPNATE